MEEDLFDVLDFAESLAAGVREIKHERRRRVMTLYYGLDGDEAATLQPIAERLGVSREAIRQHRDRAVGELIWIAMAGAAPNMCSPLVEQARRLTDRFEADPGSLLDAFEAAPGGQRAREWVILVLCLAGKRRRGASRLVEAACTRQREALLAAKLDRRATRREQLSRERRATRAERFIGRALWPSTTCHDWHPDAFSAQRSVGSHSLGHAGSFHSEKLGRTVQYESALELAFLSQLEILERVVSYQEQPLAIKYRVDDRDAVYVPDAVVILDDGRALVVEIKPAMHIALSTNLLKAAALARWCGRHGAGLLIGDGRVSAGEVLVGRCAPDYAVGLLDLLRTGSLTYRAYRSGVGAGRPVSELAAAVGAGLASWQLSPFLLRLPTPAEARDVLAFTNLLRRHQQS